MNAAYNSGSYVSYATQSGSAAPGIKAAGSANAEAYANVIKNRAFSSKPPSYVESTSSNR